MCGICGIYDFHQKGVDIQLLKSMTQTMNHRGPDDDGFVVNNHIGIGMCRLSIIDVGGGHQPMSNEDGTVEVVMNGEIYNYIELRNELISKGHTLKTNSDTEVLVHLYEEEGKKFLDKLNGMFAFIIWDKRENLIWVVRDRIGIKPLYYFKDAHQFICSSDLNALKKTLSFKLSINQESFLSYLVMGYVPEPLTIYEDIFKLQPGHWIEIKGMNVVFQKYWDVDFKQVRPISLKDAQERLKFLLKDAVKLQKRSDVPIGTFLSGGMDSSTVVALLSQESLEPVRTLTVDFIGKEDNESSFARLVSSRYKSHHFEKILDEKAMEVLLEEMMVFMDEPIADSAVIPSYFLSKIAKEKGIKVLLNGTGGDELFGGYVRHHPYPKGSKYWWIQKLPGFLRRSLGSLMSLVDYHRSLTLQDEWCYWGTSISGIDLGVLKNIIVSKRDFEHSREILRNKFSTLFAKQDYPYFSKMYHDFKNYLVGDVLSLLDKTTMACSIEGRVPFLDHRIAEFAFGIPENINILDGEPKGLLKAVIKDYLPEDIRYRSKVGFNAPVMSLMNNSLRYKLLHQLDNTNEYFQEVFDMGALKRLLGDTDKGLSARVSETLFSLCMFDGWYKENY